MELLQGPAGAALDEPSVGVEAQRVVARAIEERVGQDERPEDLHRVGDLHRAVEGPAEALGRVARKTEHELELDREVTAQVAEHTFEARDIEGPPQLPEQDRVEALHADGHLRAPEGVEEGQVIFTKERGVEVPVHGGLGQDAGRCLRFHEVAEPARAEIERGVQVEHVGHLGAREPLEVTGQCFDREHPVGGLLAPLAEAAVDRAAAKRLEVAREPAWSEVELVGRGVRIEIDARELTRRAPAERMRHQ